MGVMGPVAVYTSIILFAKAHGIHPDPFMSIQIEGIVCFLVLIAIGIALRKNPAAHKRIMILATVAIASAGFGRFMQYVNHTQPQTPFQFFLFNYYGDLLIVASMFAWD